MVKADERKREREIREVDDNDLPRMFGAGVGDSLTHLAAGFVDAGGALVFNGRLSGSDVCARATGHSPARYTMAVTFL